MEVKTEDEMKIIKHEVVVDEGESGGAKPTVKDPLQKFKRKFPNRTSGAAKKKAKRIRRMLEQFPHIPQSNGSVWPANLIDYVVHCYDRCKNDEQKKILQDMLQKKMLHLQDYGLLYKNNWHNEPLLEVTNET